jgi:hypothetical protein
MPRRFSLPQAESLLPDVERAIRAAIQCKQQYRDAEHDLAAYLQRVMVSGGMLVDRHAVVQRRSLRDQTKERLQEAVEAVHEYGCLVKDLDIGLIDFPTLYRGQEVYLCWKLGETGIHFWHGVDEGFGGRKPIDEEFLENHRGDSPN